MKILTQKLKLLLIMPALIAGIIYLNCGFVKERLLPENVTVNGIEVGGLKTEDAAKIIRAEIEKDLQDKKLEIRLEGATYTYSYPEINYTDNLYTLLKNAEKGDCLTTEVSYYLCGADEIASGICLDERILMNEPHAEFKARGEAFLYDEGNDGREVDEDKLKEDILNSVNGGFSPVTVSYRCIPRQTSLEEVKEKTQKLSEFYTDFDSSNLNRASNIRLAANRINGAVIESGKTLSFNDIVGARVKERGFLPAKIIENGEFVEGVGGGVCQVSTTLYNAALLCGLEIEEYHPHSLQVGYVDPSRDAMVSGSFCDLKIKNNRKTPIYIRAKVVGGRITFTFYGESDGARYSVISSVTGSIPAEEEKTSDPAKARDGTDGLLSEGYLEICRGGEREVKKIRKDKYSAVKRIVYEETNGQPEETPAQ